MCKSRSFIQGLVASLIICMMLVITAAPVFAGKDKTDDSDTQQYQPNGFLLNRS